MQPPDWSRIIREEIEKAERRINQRLANLVQQTQVSNPTPDGNEDGTENWPSTSGRSQRSPRRVQHFGFRSVPPKDTSTIMLLVGAGATSEVTVAEDSSGYGPTLAAGEVAIFSKASGAYIKIDANGAITLSTTSGQVFAANGATDFMLRGNTYRTAEDTLFTALSTFMAALNAFSATCVGPTPPQLVTFQAAVTTLQTAIATFQVGAANYLSTKNKLG